MIDNGCQAALAARDTGARDFALILFTSAQRPGSSGAQRGQPKQTARVERGLYRPDSSGSNMGRAQGAQNPDGDNGELGQSCRAMGAVWRERIRSYSQLKINSHSKDKPTFI